MLSKYTKTALGLSFAVWGGTMTLACGSSEEDGGLSGSGANGSGATGGTTTINVGGSGATTGTGTHDGGSIPLTEDEVDAIADSACAGWSTEGESLPAVLQLVVDVSGSMEDPAPGSNGSKWDVTSGALNDAIDSLPDSVSLGVLYYPNQQTGSSDTARDVDECVNVDEMVPIDLLGANNHRDDVIQSLDDADTGSLTPTHDAYRYALAQGLIPYQTSSRKFMLLITDGAPTMRLDCIGEGGGGGGMVMDQPTQPIIDEIAGANDVGIRTFLIGSPGSEESSESNTDMRPWLSRAAIAGGTAAANCEENGPNFCHMDMTQEPDFAQALADGLASVVGQVVDSCTFAIPPSPDGQAINPAETNLIINWSNGDSTLILPDNTGDCSEGWQFTGTDEVTLCSASCDAIQGDAGARVQLTFGCSTEEVIPVR
jgi:hypothetical protein